MTGHSLKQAGAGKIGRELARKARAFDMRVVGVKKNPETLEYFDTVVPDGQLYDVLGGSDFVVNLAPLTPETRKMIGAAFFEAMKESAVFMNFSRGGVVDEPALIEALKRNRIRGAVLDVFETEPLPETHPLWSMPNVMISPHIAGTTWRQEMRELELFKKLYRQYKNGEPLSNRVDLLRRY